MKEKHSNRHPPNDSPLYAVFPQNTSSVIKVEKFPKNFIPQDAQKINLLVLFFSKYVFLPNDTLFGQSAICLFHMVYFQCSHRPVFAFPVSSLSFCRDSAALYVLPQSRAPFLCRPHLSYSFFLPLVLLAPHYRARLFVFHRPAPCVGPQVLFLGEYPAAAGRSRLGQKLLRQYFSPALRRFFFVTLLLRRLTLFSFVPPCVLFVFLFLDFSSL